MTTPYYWVAVASLTIAVLLSRFADWTTIPNALTVVGLVTVFLDLRLRLRNRE